jgi:uncharacterized protein
MKRILLPLYFFIAGLLPVFGQQKNYTDSLKNYQEKYVKEHEVVKGKDKEAIRFFNIDKKYQVAATFKKVYELDWFQMETSGKNKQTYRVYGLLHFKLNDTLLTLNVYQSKDLMGMKEYADYLFVPFTDKTCGEETYENGRYIDIRIKDVEAGTCLVDFNKAYNPYCAYVSNVFNCPIPPKENDIPVAIKSGEMKFSKSH